MTLRAWTLAFAIGAGSMVGITSPARGADSPAPLIPREVLFGNPERANVQLSPDGKTLSYLAAVDGVLNVWVAPTDEPSRARAITDDKSRGIRQYFWCFNNSHIVYLKDKGGDENWRAYSVNIATGEQKDLTPFDGVAAQIQEVSDRFPDEIVIGLNNRNAQLHDLHRVNVITGERTLLRENDGYLGFVVDHDFKVRMASRFNATGGVDNFIVKPDGAVEPYDTVPMEDSLTTQNSGFDKTGTVLYGVDSRGRNTAALVATDLKTGEKRVIAEDPLADTTSVLSDPKERTIQAVSFLYDRMRWKVIDEAVASDFAYLRSVAEGDFSINSQTLDNSRWLVAFVQDDGPVKYFLYDRKARKASFLFTNRPALEGLTLAKMHPHVIKSRDGLNLVSYCSVPPWTDSDGDGIPSQPLPTVLLVHGGPWARDSWGYNSYHQWLTNRGYAVLSVNFRGSTGLGKEFLNAGNLEWAGKMHDDLLDAVDWAISKKVAVPDQVGIMGGSYGGYATLVGLTFTPERFACGVDIVGPSNIVTLLNTIPPYWAPALELFKKRVGDHTTDEGRAFLKERSPLSFVDRISKPLLIGQGANDPRVKQAESDQIVEAMKAKNIPVTYVLFPDEGHGFARPENNKAFNAVTEAFLSQHLGGRYQPIDGDFKGSSIAVPHGAGQVPGLADAVKPE
ncbi:MAG TPA: S9 family peptidase [Phycisphaerales bacterium]|nr:S9 family peptidase [Phycisphaerales bacterium]